MYNDNSPSWEKDIRFDRGSESEPAEPEFSGKARIKVIGVGGAGNNAVNRLIDAGISSAEYVAVNTDAQILACSKAEHKIQIGAQRTKGLGAGADPEIGRIAAEEDKEKLLHEIENTDLLFITAGMGGGTGTGAAPVIAKIAKDLKILTVAVVTEPFKFEGKQRKDNSMRGLDNLRKYVDALIIIPNEKIKDIVPKGTPIDEAFRVADDVLRQGIRGIADLIVTPALINLDFADVRAILKDRGLAYMGVGVAKGDNRIYEAVRLAVNSPLLQTTIEGATGVILNIVGGKDLSFDEADSAATLIHGVVDYTANIIVGACIDENIHDEVEVTVIATGFPSASMRENMKNGGNAQGGRPVRLPAYNPSQPREPGAPQGGFANPQPQGVNPYVQPQNPYSAQPQGNPYAAQQRTAPVPPAGNPPYGQQPMRPSSPLPQGGYAQQPVRQPSYGAQPQNPYGGTPQNPYSAQPQGGNPYAQPARNVTTVPPMGSQNPYAQPAQRPSAPAPQGYPQQNGYPQPQPSQPGYPQQNGYSQPQGYPQQPVPPQGGYPQPQPQAGGYPAGQPQAGNESVKRPAPSEEPDDDLDDDFDAHGAKNIPEFVRKIIRKNNS